MITETDIKELKKIFVTKKDLTNSEERLNKRIDRVMDYINFKLEPFEKFQKEFTEFKVNITTTLDWLVGAFKKFDEELTVIAHRNRLVADKLENHEIRISKLEL